MVGSAYRCDLSGIRSRGGGVGDWASSAVRVSDGQHLRADLTVVLKPKAWGDVGVERVVVGRGRPWQDNPFGVDFEIAQPSAWQRSAVKSRVYR